MVKVRSLQRDLTAMEKQQQRSHTRLHCGSSTDSTEAGSAAHSRSTSSSASESRQGSGTTGSRFDILTRGSFADGQQCSRGVVRRATKACRDGTSKSRGREDIGATHNTQNVSGGGDDAGAQVGGASPTAAGSAGVAPPGEPCRISSHTPYKRLQAQPFSHILVCDFEATCESGSVCYPHEIIEFPAVVLDTATLRVVAEFHAYVRPVRNPRLTQFCTELTGITQAMTDAADTLPAVLERFQQWIREVVYPLCREWRARYGPEKLTRHLRSEQKHFVYEESTEEARACVEEEKMVCFATDGPWDMRRFMHECSVLRDGIDFPPLFYRYINVRHCFCDLLKTKQVKLTHMLRRLSMSFEGQRHSGIADSHNIARVLAELLARGYRIGHVSIIKYYHRGDAFLEGNRAAQELLAEYGEEDERRPARPHNANNKTNHKSGGAGKGHKKGVPRTQQQQRRNCTH